MKKLARGIPRLIARVRARGWREVGALAVARARGELWSGDTLLFLVQETSGPPASSDDLSFRRATTSDAVAYARDIGTDSETTFASRLTGGTSCFLAEMNGHLVHASWVTTDASWAVEVRGWLAPPPGDAYIYESFTRADARGRGIYPFALRNISATLAGEGVKRAWIAVEEDNAPSRRSIDKAGFQPAFSLTYRRRLGRLLVDAPTGPQADIGERFLRRGKGREK